jgi:hypothetical protein
MMAGSEGVDRRTLIKGAAIAGAAAWTTPLIIDSLSSPAAAASCVPCGPAGPGGIGGGGGYPSTPVCNIDSPDATRTWYVFKIQNSTCSNKGGNVLSGIAAALTQLQNAGITVNDQCPPGVSGNASCSDTECVVQIPSTCNVAVSQTFGGGEIHAGSDDCQPTLTPCSATGGCQITMPNCSSHNISFLQMIICCS